MRVKEYAMVYNEVADLKPVVISLDRSRVTFRIPSNQANKLKARLNQFGPVKSRSNEISKESRVTVFY